MGSVDSSIILCQRVVFSLFCCAYHLHDDCIIAIQGRETRCNRVAGELVNCQGGAQPLELC